MAKKNSVSMLTHSFPVPPTWFQYFSDFQLEKHLTRPQTQPNIFICLLDHADEAPLGNIKIKRQWWPAKPLISGRSGTHYVAMVKMLISSYCEAHLVESFCKKSNIWYKLAELSLFIIFDKNSFEYMTSSLS